MVQPVTLLHIKALPFNSATHAYLAPSTHTYTGCTSKTARSAPPNYQVIPQIIGLVNNVTNLPSRRVVEISTTIGIVTAGIIILTAGFVLGASQKQRLFVHVWCTRWRIREALRKSDARSDVDGPPRHLSSENCWPIWRRLSECVWQPSHRAKWSRKEYQGCFLESWMEFYRSYSSVTLMVYLPRV